MIPPVQAAFNEMIRRWPPPGPRVLELGATAETAAGFAQVFRGCDYIGIDLAPTERDQAAGVVQGDANSMPQFGEGTMDAIVTSSMFEHNPMFWLAIAEVRRVLKPGGVFYVGVPGFTDRVGIIARYAQLIRNRLNSSGLAHLALAANWAVATRTYPFHMGPHDYFRFSPEAMRHVLLDGFEVLEIRQALSPARLLGAGRLS